jgi:cell division protein FtsI/penicillin-binding protein 2
LQEGLGVMLGRTDSRRRLIVLVLLLILVGGGLISRLAWWQLVRHEALAAMAHGQTHLRMVVENQRGSIYDRSGTIVLATTVDRVRVVASAKGLKPADQAADVEVLAETLNLDPVARVQLAERLQSDRPYVVLARDVDSATAELLRAAIRERRLVGVSLEAESARVYPQAGGGPGSSLAAQLLGFVNRDGDGQYGVEQYYDDRLAGSATVYEAEKDANGRAIADTELIVQPGVPGADLRLTIDAGLQLAIEQELLAAWIADRAAAATAVVMDPWTGEIYASASYPSYDANDYRTTATESPARFIDPTISRVYEPGSVFKMLTVLAGFEQGTVAPKTEMKDERVLVLDEGKARIRNSDHGSMGTLTFEDGIGYSRNIIAAKAALGLGPTLKDSSAILHETWLRMGFGQPTGVDLAGEVGGLVRDPAISAWREIDLANGSFGQGVAVTPMQLARAYAAMINGGRLVTPHVVAAVDGHDVNVDPGRQVLPPELVPDLTGMLEHVLTMPTYAAGQIPGYTVGGKTGTAQIWDTKVGAWRGDIFNFSFVGFIGRRSDHPDLVIAIQIHDGRPRIPRVGVLNLPIRSFELFRRIAMDAVFTPGLLPELPPEPERVSLSHR